MNRLRSISFGLFFLAACLFALPAQTAPSRGRVIDPMAVAPCLALPKDKLDEPVLFTSRLLESNRTHGKVFAPGQRSPLPVLMTFSRKDSASVTLRLLDYRSPQGYRCKRPKIPCPPISFPLLRESADSLWLDVSGYFSTYPQIVSVVPRKFLKDAADSVEFLGIRTRQDYMQLVTRYHYPGGMVLKVASSFLFLDREAMTVRQVDARKVGYNYAEFIDSSGRLVRGIRKWNLEAGKQLVFYVDSACPAPWFPYIKEGIEDWNKALEKAGVTARIVVVPEPGRSLALRRDPLANWVRMMPVDEPNAKGDVLFDPRSGEILQADILIWKGLPRLLSDWRYVQTGAADPVARQDSLPIEVLGPMLRYSICHEMGHVLGLSHNMGASYAYPSAALRKVGFTRQYGTAASVMDYARFNHLATAADFKRGVYLLPPRLGPYDEYAIAWGYAPSPAPSTPAGVSDSTSADASATAFAPKPGQYCYFAPNQSGPISPDPSALPDALGDDLLASSKAALTNCRTLLTLDGLTGHRTQLLRRYYYRSIYLTLSHIGGVIDGKPVGESLQRRTLDFIFRQLATVPPALRDERLQQQILDELDGNFLPRRVCENGGDPALQRYRRHLARLHKRWPQLQFTRQRVP